jgi:ribonucleoside-diphosphate reductase alpha chain
MIEKIKGKDHNVVKLDGRVEKYSPKKMKKSLLRISGGNEILADDLFNSLNIKIYDRIKIDVLWDEVIETCANKISEMYTIYDEIARRAYTEKVYKSTYNLTSELDTLSYLDVVRKGVQSGVYDREVVNHFTDEEIIELGEYIERDRDQDFTFIGIVFFMEKYAYNYTQTKKLELPQHTYMRIAMFPYYKEEDSQRKIQLIKERYDELSEHLLTEASPKVNNSLSSNSQMASCVTNTVLDDSRSICHTDTNMALFSKYGGGLALDISALRCSGSLVGKSGGKSSGPVKFVQKYEATIGAFDQVGKRKGACVITFPFWHYDVQDLIMLKDAGGSEDKRARGLMYTVKWYKILTDRILAGEDISLFDPKETPELNETWGEEFEKWYNHYEQKQGIRRKRIPARDLAFLIAKVRSETGNLYIVFPDNINSQRVGELPVFSSNLCCEIFIPSKASSGFREKINVGLDGKPTITSEYESGEIGLCNLSSINVIKWVALSHEEKVKMVDNLLRASDNLLYLQYYPVKEGEISNHYRRPIGIGISNYANYLASNEAKYTDEKAKQLTHELMEDITYYVLEGSVRLAKERGAYHYFKDSNWAKGKLPMDLYKMKDVEGYNYPLKHDWESLRKDIMSYGVRFSYHFAIAPTASSGVAINATEGVEPIKRLSQMKEGTYTLPQLVPNIQKNRMWYQNAFDIPNTVINDLASIRQKFLDQGQSVSHYYKETDSAHGVIYDIMHAEHVGMKSLYYLQPMKAGDFDGCESCSS